MKEINPHRVRELFTYDPITGKLTWKHRPLSSKEAKRWNTRYAGKEAGHWRRGRGTVTFDQVSYEVNRVVFVYIHGRNPKELVDHENGDGSDNRPNNLRDASRLQNNRNRHKACGTSQYRGVSWRMDIKRWAASGKDRNSKQRHLGFFDDELAAARAYDAFVLREHGEFARPNKWSEITEV